MCVCLFVCCCFLCCLSWLSACLRVVLSVYPSVSPSCLSLYLSVYLFATLSFDTYVVICKFTRCFFQSNYIDLYLIGPDSSPFPYYSFDQHFKSSDLASVDLFFYNPLKLNSFILIVYKQKFSDEDNLPGCWRRQIVETRMFTCIVKSCALLLPCTQ